MIIIAIVFGCLALLEWRYLRRNNRKRRTVVFVMGTAAFLLIAMEAAYAVRERMTVVAMLEAILGPVQDALTAKK